MWCYFLKQRKQTPYAILVSSAAVFRDVTQRCRRDFCGKLYSIPYQNCLFSIPYSRPELPDNHTPHSGTYPWGLCKAVLHPPPPPNYPPPNLGLVLHYTVIRVVVGVHSSFLILEARRNLGQVSSCSHMGIITMVTMDGNGFPSFGLFPLTVPQPTAR